MKNKTCGSCRWRILFDEENGPYSHIHNTREHCFCLVKDFYTEANCDDEICEQYIFDNDKDEL